MTISVPVSPVDGRQLVEEHLSALGYGQDIALGLDSEAGGASTPAPLPVWEIGLQDLAEGRDHALRVARQSGWHYIIVKDGPSPIVELDTTKSENAVRSLLGDGAGDKLAEAARFAENEADPAQDFEARVLDLRGVGMMLLWLHGNGTEDLAFDLGEDEISEQPLSVLIDRAGARARQKLDARDETSEATERGG